MNPILYLNVMLCLSKFTTIHFSHTPHFNGDNTLHLG